MRNYTESFAHTDQRIADVYSLRYKVYCEERGFERPEDHPGAAERDEYDEVATHFAAIRQQRVIGTARIIFHTGKGFPLEKHARVEGSLLQEIGRDAIGEVSRLAFSKEYRQFYQGIEAREGSEAAEQPPPRGAGRNHPECDLILRLYRCIYQECREKNITHLIAIMADGLYRLLAMNGIEFAPIGPPVEYHGRRTPYICCIEKSLQQLKDNRPATYRFITGRWRGGRPS